MLNIDTFEKNNLKVLGILVRYKRVTFGYSLRDLGKITNISHTLISNFERGNKIPHNDTIKDIFKFLELDFYNDPNISKDFSILYKKILEHLFFYEYEDAKELIKTIEKKRNIYEHSVEVINFMIIRYLFYLLTGTYIEEKDKGLDQYEVVLEFFSSTQKQLFYFIKGLDKLNQEYYSQAGMFFEKALRVGDRKIDLLIKEYYVKTLSKTNKFVDSRIIADKCIREYEKQTNYVRAMRLRIMIAYDFIRIFKYKEAKEMYNFVYNYSVKYKVEDLENDCNTRMAHIAILEKDFEKARDYLVKVTPPYSRVFYYIKFDLIIHFGTEDDFLNYYNKVMANPWINSHPKTMNFFKLILMRYDTKYMDKKEYERILKEQINYAFLTNDSETMEISSKFLIRFYKSERRYKNALEVSENFLHRLRYGTNI